jgi:MFS transporter, BCD family, chlorophyll transporter
MMVIGIVISSVAVGKMIEPFSAQSLAFAATAVVGFAFVTTIIALYNMEPETADVPFSDEPEASDGTPITRADFFAAFKEIWSEPLALRFTIFVFLSMIAYSAQDLILEPFAGMVFNMSPGETSRLSGLQNGGALLGMIITGVAGGRSSGGKKGWMQTWTVLGCIGSAISLLGICVAASVGPSFPFKPVVFMLGFTNGVFAISAIGSMMGLAGVGRSDREGMRMGIWGASQAIAMGLGNFAGAAGVDAMRAISLPTADAYQVVFAAEAFAFIAAAVLASTAGVATS